MIAAMIRAVVPVRRRPRRMPAQVWPTTIAREYTKELLVICARIDLGLAELRAALPGLLESAAADRNRADAGEGKKVRDIIFRAGEVVAKTIRTEDIERMAEKFAARTSTHQRIQLGRQVKAVIGADPWQSDQGLRVVTEHFVAENVSLIKDLAPAVYGKIERAVTRGVASGTLHTELAGEVEKALEGNRNRAKLIARDQIGKLYGQINAKRSENLGATHFTWRTAADERVRPAHAQIDGQVFSFEAGAPGEGLPGEPVLCRCFADPILDDLLKELDSL